MVEFLTSGTFLVIMEIVVIASLGAALIWRIKKNNQAAEKRREQQAEERDRQLTRQLMNDLAGKGAFAQGKGGGRFTILVREKDRKHSETFGIGQAVRIGRSADNDLVLESPYAARHQCTLVWQNTRLFLQQQDVKNRITILRSGKGIEHTEDMERLQDRDVLKIADVSLEIHLSGKA